VIGYRPKFQHRRRNGMATKKQAPAKTARKKAGTEFAGGGPTGRGTTDLGGGGKKKAGASGKAKKKK
jgi:hypothetical protein